MLGLSEENIQLENSKHRSQIWREQIHRVENNASLSNVVSMIVAILLAIMLWQDTGNEQLLIWLCYMQFRVNSQQPWNITVRP